MSPIYGWKKTPGKFQHVCLLQIGNIFHNNNNENNNNNRNLQTTLPSEETLIQITAVKCSLIQNKNTDPIR